MKRALSLSFWPLIAAAGLIVVSALAWLAYPASQPGVSMVPRAAIPDRKTTPSHAPLLVETTAIADPGSPSARSAASPISETDEQQRTEEIARQAEIAQKLAGFRAEVNAAAAIPDIQKRNESLERICYHWAEFDPRGALALACDLRLDGAGVLENLTQQWAGTDLPAARAWIAAQPSSETKARLVARVGFIMAQTEPENAADYVIDETPPGEVQTEAAISVIHQWAQQDRRAATAWALKFPAGALRDRALQETSPPPGAGGAD